ncbi:MAG TPA: hypothetical protein VMW74_03455, partial [Nitrosopumilaceae archaeon]|nr:hypothetical protein [Nitrosopumilaceae archaeon]
MILLSKIVGRNTEVEQLVRYLLGYKKGNVVPLVSIFGRSGKSALVKYVCNLSTLNPFYLKIKTDYLDKIFSRAWLAFSMPSLFANSSIIWCCSFVKQTGIERFSM